MTYKEQVNSLSLLGGQGVGLAQKSLSLLHYEILSFFRTLVVPSSYSSTRTVLIFCPSMVIGGGEVWPFLGIFMMSFAFNKGGGESRV